MTLLNSYLPFILAAQSARIAALTDFAQEDPCFTGLLQRSEDLSVVIKFGWWGAPATYQPALRAGDAHSKAQLQLSYRFGPNVVAHCWLHEWLHLAQDQAGMMPEAAPHRERRERISMLDVCSDISRFLLCEALAATEAIRASWRLKQRGLPQAWRGACAIRDVKTLAARYAESLAAGETEQHAARSLFLRWYDLPQRQFYERTALQGWQRAFKRNCLAGGRTPEPPVLHEIKPLRFLGLLPDGQQADYLQDVWEETEAMLVTIKNAEVKRACDNILAAYGKGSRAEVVQLTNDSLIYQGSV